MGKYGRGSGDGTSHFPSILAPFFTRHLYQVLFGGRVLWQEEKEVGGKKEGLEERVG